MNYLSYYETVKRFKKYDQSALTVGKIMQF